MRKLEVCCADIESVMAAKKGGADRVELCSALETGGLTPSLGLIEAAVKLFGQNVNVLIRERPGNYNYSQAELDVMRRDIEICREAGVGAVVIGALDESGNVDINAIRYLMEAAQGLEVTFHRAFDEVESPLEALEQIIGCGCHRILTSGQKDSAYSGKELLKELNRQSNGRILILPGAGVTYENAAEILDFTGCNEIHASAKVHSEAKGCSQSSEKLINKIKEAIS